MPRLLVNPGTPEQWEAPLQAGVNTIGRSGACDIQIEHDSVSGTHCELSVNGTSVHIRDLGSTNGTFLNRTPVQESTWAAGQRLQLGGVEMELVPDAAARLAGSVAVPAAVRLAVARPATPASSAPPASAIPRAPAISAISATPATAAVTASAPAEPASIPSAPPRVSLRVANQAPAPPPPPETPPAYVAEEYTTEADAPAKCKYHPSTLGRFLCPECQLNYCELCVTTRPGGSRTGKFCRRCGGECVALNVQLIPEHADKESFWGTLPSMFAYPFKGSGVTFLVCGMFFLALINFLGAYSPFLQMLYVAYTFAYVQRVIHTAAQGSDEAAGWPDISDWWGDILVPCLQLLTLAIVCAGPALAVLFLFESGPEKMILLIAVAGLGAVYYPMAFLAMAMFDSAGAINPLVVFPAMIRIPIEYLAVLLLTAIIILVRVAQGYFIQLLGIPVLPTLITSFVGLYFLTVQGRMLGLLYFTKRERLGWFRTR